MNRLRPHEIHDAVSYVNEGLQLSHITGLDVPFAPDFKPDFTISSFEPIVGHEYRRFIKRAPRSLGSLTLRQLVHRPESREIVVIGQESETQGYGFTFNSQDRGMDKFLWGQWVVRNHPDFQGAQIRNSMLQDFEANVFNDLEGTA